MGVRKGMMEKEEKINVETEKIVVGEVEQGKNKWRIIEVYVSKGIDTMSRNVKRWIEKKEKKKRY